MLLQKILLWGRPFHYLQQIFQGYIFIFRPVASQSLLRDIIFKAKSATLTVRIRMTKLDKLYNCNSYVFMEVVDTNKMQSECLIVPLSFFFPQGTWSTGTSDPIYLQSYFYDNGFCRSISVHFLISYALWQVSLVVVECYRNVKDISYNFNENLGVSRLIKRFVILDIL